MNAFGLKNFVLGAACASMLIAGSGGAMAQSVAKPAKAAALNCDAKAQRGKAACSRVARATAPVSAEARNPGGPMVWDVVETWLKAKGKISSRRLNTPEIES